MKIVRFYCLIRAGWKLNSERRPTRETDLWDDESSSGQLLHHRVEFVRRSAQQRIGSLTKHMKSLSDLIETAQRSTYLWINLSEKLFIRVYSNLK